MDPAPIHSLLREGQHIVVQVIRDAISTKGARLTTHLTLPSRNLVFLPRSKHIGVSQRLEDPVERERLQAALTECLTAYTPARRGGFILRTAAEGTGIEELHEDIRFVHRLWQSIEQKITPRRHWNITEAIVQFLIFTALKMKSVRLWVVKSS